MPKFLVRAIYKSHRDMIVEADDFTKASNLDGEVLDEDEVDLEFYDVVSVEEMEDE